MISRGLIVRHFSKERAGKSIRPGAAIVLNGMPHRVTKITQGKRGKGGGFIRATLKNLMSPQHFEKTFTSDEIVEHADLEKTNVQYSWNDGATYHFIDSVSYEEIDLAEDDVDCKDYLIEGQDVKLMWFKGNVIGVEIPLVCEYIVNEIGQLLESGVKNAVIANGVTVQVPEFIGQGNKIRVNTADGTYVDRGSS